jgi:electron transfer flavoprotein beta subunit
MRGIMSARTKPLQVIAAQEIEELAKITKFETPAPRSNVKLIDSATAEQLINLLHTEAKVI